MGRGDQKSEALRGIPPQRVSVSQFFSGSETSGLPGLKLDLHPLKTGFLRPFERQALQGLGEHLDKIPVFEERP